MPRQQRTGRPYLRHRASIVNNGQACGICAFPVNKDISGKTTWGPSLHHPWPLARGGPLMDGNGVLAHTGCNAAVRDAVPGTERYASVVRRRRALYVAAHSGYRVAVGSDGRVLPRSSRDHARLALPSREW